AELAEHAALQVHVEAVQHLLRLAGLVLLVVPVDVDDVDRALDRAERALDAALLVQPEHAAEAVRRQLLLLRVLDRDLLLEEMAPGGGEPVKEAAQRARVEPLLQRHQPSTACGVAARRSRRASARRSRDSRKRTAKQPPKIQASQTSPVVRPGKSRTAAA